MGRPKFLHVDRLLSVIRTPRRRTLLLTGLTLAAVPVSAAAAHYMEHDDTSEPNFIHASVTGLNHTEDTVSAEPVTETPTDTASNLGNSSTSVIINGQDIPADSNGNVHETVKEDGATTTVNVDNSGTGDTGSQSSTTIKVNAKTTTFSTADNSKERSTTSVKIKSTSH